MAYGLNLYGILHGRGHTSIKDNNTEDHPIALLAADMQTREMEIAMQMSS